ncbi:LamG domain-containing protein [Desulfurobacterium sp.]
MEFFKKCLFFVIAFFFYLPANAAQEGWAEYCTVVQNIKTPIYHSEEGFGWKYPIRRIGDADPPPGGTGGAFYLHPVSTEIPAHLRCKFPGRAIKSFRIKVAGNRNGDWVMVLKVNGKTVKTALVDGKRWHVYTVPVDARGRYTTVDLFAKANGWFFEYAFVDEIKPVFYSSNNRNAGQGLVAYYSFDTCTAKDYSGHALDGKIKGSVACVNGVKGKAFYFSGNGYVKLPPFNAMWDRGMSVCAWAKFEEPRNFERIIDFGNGPGDSNGMNVWFGRRGRTNDVCVESWVNADGSFNREKGRLTFPEGIENGRKRFYCFTINNRDGEMTIYIDGKRVARKMGNPVANVKRFQNYIGHSNWSFFDPDFKGMIDEVKIFNYPLSSRQVAALYAADSSAGKAVEESFNSKQTDRVKFGRCAVIDELSAEAFRKADAQPTFSTGVRRVFAVCKFSSAGKSNIEAVWYYMGSSNDEKEYIIRKSITVTRPVVNNYLKFYMEMPPGKNWPQGKYEVDILVDGKLRKTLYFNMK